ncbi:hypothetical protein DSLASN_23150 [Desulfoluna limicola]|uniref:CO-methylating acetyl-CoA synthase n=1 Tax=Desulfoluna limicola TaxID=2810562 RepID=A0ABM7PHW3_9BACT|nr:hypothetical protein [Desulfoluna limicola]BCS96683.1 hypothetical protein DSLASN_23150 [Desulfoluna limicola]
MGMFDAIICDVKAYVGTRAGRRLPERGDASWPGAGRNNLVLLADLALELGNPADGSVSFLVSTEEEALVDDGRITLIGPDIGEAPGPRLPFGKVVIVHVEGEEESLRAKRHREMFLLKFALSLKGYMVKAASRYMAEWSRISKEAVDSGFSFTVLGHALMEGYRRLDYVKAVEVVFVTSSGADVNGLYDMGHRALRRVDAMNKRTSEMTHDCSSCGYKDVCDEAEELREARAARG